MEKFETVYKDNADAILKFISFKINDFETAQELTNDVFMRVHKHWDNYDETKSSMRTWVISITKNVLIDHYRKKKRILVSIDAFVDNEDSTYKYKVDKIYLNVTEPTPFQLISSSETMKHLHRSITSLPKKCKRIANLYFNHGMKYKAIAKHTGMTLSNVKVTIFRSRQFLIKKLTI